MKDLFLDMCVRCGTMDTAERPLQADHVIPYSKGGGNGINNIQPLCMTCNTGKGNRFTTDFRFTFFSKFRIAHEKIQDCDFLRSRIRILLSLIDPLGNSFTPEQGNDLIYGWWLRGELRKIAIDEIEEWIGLNCWAE